MTSTSFHFMDTKWHWCVWFVNKNKDRWSQLCFIGYIHKNDTLISLVGFWKILFDHTDDSWYFCHGPFACNREQHTVRWPNDWDILQQRTLDRLDRFAMTTLGSQFSKCDRFKSFRNRSTQSTKFRRDGQNAPLASARLSGVQGLCSSASQQTRTTASIQPDAGLCIPTMKTLLTAFLPPRSSLSIELQVWLTLTATDIWDARGSCVRVNGPKTKEN